MPRFTLTRRSGVAEVVFDDGRMNLLSRDALEELRAIVQAAVSSGARVLSFHSARSGVFAAGADMAEMQRFGPRDAEEFSRLGQSTFAALEAAPMLTVAMVDGDCFGGALDLLLAFDLRFTTPRSRFSHPGAKLGIVTGFGGTSRWRHQLPRPAARTLFLGNGVLGARQALEAGIVDSIGDPDLGQLASLDPAAVRLVKDLVRHGEGISRRELSRLAEVLGAVYALSGERISRSAGSGSPDPDPNLA